MGYVYGSEATNADITARSIEPLLRKFLEGYNVCVMGFGATGVTKGGPCIGRALARAWLCMAVACPTTS